MLLSLGCFFSSLELVTHYKGQDEKAEPIFVAADFCLPWSLRGPYRTVVLLLEDLLS